MSLTKVSYSMIQGAQVNVLDYGADATGVNDSTAAITNALAAVTSTTGTVYLPAGTYKVTDGFVVPSGSSVYMDPACVINFDSTNFYAFQLKEKSSIYGNNARLNILNATWNGAAIYLDGADTFYEPTVVDGLNIWGDPAVHAANNLGTAIYLKAESAGNVISWTRFTNMTLYGLNYGISCSAGTSGDAGDSATWHWVNANTFNNISCYHVNKGIALRGLQAVPAECAGNFFNNIEIQTTSTGLPIYISGASQNYLNVHIWDFFGKNSVTFDQTISQPQLNVLVCNSRLEDMTITGPQNITSLYGQSMPFYHLAGTTTRNGVYTAYTSTASQNLFSGECSVGTGNVFGTEIYFSGQTPNNKASKFFNGHDSTGSKFLVYSNGGIANYQANDENLSDERLKKNFEAAPSYYDKWKEIEFYTYLYKDQTDTQKNLGVKAQQVESVCPELVAETNLGSDEKPEVYKSIYQTDFNYAMAKALQEAIQKIDSLEQQLNGK